METQDSPPHWKYHAEEEFLASPELGPYHTYGIQVSEQSGDVWSVVGLLHDVAVDQQIAESMAALYTIHQLSPIHLKDVVADMLP